MNEDKISATAATSALMRALACYETSAIGGLKQRDNLAHIFLDEEKRAKLASEAYRNAVKAKARDGLFPYVIARTAYFDRVCLDALHGGTTQIVILGAGFDSRAYRYHDQCGPARIFEIDAPPTQAHKRAILSRHGIDAGHVKFVAVDFEKDDMLAHLIRQGFAAGAITLWIWEGVTPYLTAAAVTATFEAIATLTGRGTLAFDYLICPLDGEKTVTRKDETVRFGLTPDAMVDLLRRFAFVTRENIGADEMRRQFLTLPDGSIFGAIKQTMAFIKAEKAGK